jgi:hypothetical protein
MFKPDPLPKAERHDIGGAFLQGFRQAGEHERKKAILDRQGELQSLKLQEFKENKPMRQQALKMRQKLDTLKMDQQFKAMGESMLSAVDPDADPETFNKQVITVGKQIESMFVERYGFPPEAASMMMKYMFQSGGMTREAIRQRQIDMGIRKPEEVSKPQTKIVDGQLVTIEDGKATASDIEGFDKKASDTSPTPTDIDDYRDLMRDQFKADNDGKEPSSGWLAKRMLEFKRAQAPEVREKTASKLAVESQWKPIIKYNVELQKRLAEIETAPELAKAKGEVSPTEKRDNAKKRVSGVLSGMSGNYLKLDSMGAIANVDKPTVDNIIASIQSSGSGQFVSRIVGSKAQSLRQKIKNSKPILINDIRKASEMGARGMDSEKELEFYLSAVGDEKKDIQSSLAALSVLDMAYGDGSLADVLMQRGDIASAAETLKSELGGVQNTIEVTNPQTGEKEVWDLDTKKRIK